MRVLVFGDSIAYGAWDTEAGWVERVKRDAHRQTVQTKGLHSLQVLNLGIGSDSSVKILRRLKAEIDSRYSQNWPLVFVFSFGANDQRMTGDSIETSLKEFEHNVNEIIRIAKQYSKKIMFLGIPPMGMDSIVFVGQEYSDERMKIYDNLLSKVVIENSCTYIPTRPAFEELGLNTKKRCLL